MTHLRMSLQAGYDTTWNSGGFPMRLGGNSAPWSMNARASTKFTVDGQLVLVVASSSGVPSSTGGAAVVYVWNSTHQTFMYHSSTSQDPGACSLANFFHEGSFYVVVANSYTAGSTQSVNVYRWQGMNGGLTLHHSLEPDVSDPSSILYASKVQYFERAGKHHLAVAYFWDGSTYDVGSYIYRWEDRFIRPAALNQAEVARPQFVPIQILPSRGCMEVSVMSVLHSMACVLGRFHDLKKEASCVLMSDMMLSDVCRSIRGNSGRFVCCSCPRLSERTSVTAEATCTSTGSVMRRACLRGLSSTLQPWVQQT